MTVKKQDMIDGSERCLYSLIEKVVNVKLEVTHPVELNADKMLNYRHFLQHYNDKYTKLKKIEWEFDHVLKTSAFIGNEAEEELVGMRQYLARVKRTVMKRTFDRLGPQVIEASRSTSRLVDLMFQKRVKSEEFHQIVAGLARWHVLDDLQKQLQPHDFSPCFEGFGRETRAGRPLENIYELADKEHLRDTLEALYKEKYDMTVAHGCTKSQALTKQFLFAFMLSLYRNQLSKLYGKMAAFQRFFTEICGDTFIKTAETYQKWYRDYQGFVDERKRRASNLPKNETEEACKAWMRKEKKYDLLENLAQWISERLPQHGIQLA